MFQAALPASLTIFSHLCAKHLNKLPFSSIAYNYVLIKPTPYRGASTCKVSLRGVAAAIRSNPKWNGFCYTHRDAFQTKASLSVLCSLTIKNIMQVAFTIDLQEKVSIIINYMVSRYIVQIRNLGTRKKFLLNIIEFYIGGIHEKHGQFTL